MAPFVLNPRIKSILDRALGENQYTVAPMFGGAVQVFNLNDEPLGYLDEFGPEQINISGLRVESQTDVNTGVTQSVDTRAVQAIRAMANAKVDSYDALAAYLGGEDQGDETAWNQPRGAPYLPRSWERTQTQAWRAWEMGSQRIAGIEGGAFAARVHGSGSFRGGVPGGGIRPIERSFQLSAITQGHLGFPADEQGGIRTDMGDKSFKRWKLQRREALLPTTGPRALPDLPGKWPTAGLRGPIGAGELQWGFHASIRAPGVGPESGIPVYTATSLRKEIGPPGQMWVDPDRLPEMARVRQFYFPLTGKNTTLTAMSIPGVNLGGYGEEAEIARTERGPLSMRVGWGSQSRISWMKEVTNLGTGTRALMGELEELRPAGSWMEMKFLNKGLATQRPNLEGIYGVPGLQAVTARWKSRRQGAAAVFGGLTDTELRDVMGKYAPGLNWQQGQQLVWGTEQDVPIMRAFEQYVQANTKMLRHQEEVAASMLPGLKDRIVGSPQEIGPGTYSVTLEDPYFVGKQLMQFQTHYPARARLRTEELGYMIDQGGEMAERAQRHIEGTSFQRERYTELMNLYLSQTRRGREMGVRPVSQATELSKLDWASIQELAGASPDEETLLGAMAQVVGRTPIKMPWGTTWASPLSIWQHRNYDRTGQMQGMTHSYARAMLHQLGGGFEATRGSSPYAGAFEREWIRQVRGPGFRKEMMSAQLERGGIAGGIHGSMALQAHEMWVSREALAKLTGIDDPEKLDLLEKDIERRAMKFRELQAQGLGTEDVLPEDMPLTAHAIRRPVSDPWSQVGTMLALRAGNLFAEHAGLEGAYFGVSPVFQSVQWGDFDKDDLLAEFLANELKVDAESGSVSYKPGPGGLPATEAGVVRRLAESLAGRGGSGDPNSMGYADMLEYVWNAAPPGAQLSDLGGAMQEFPTGMKGLQEALEWTGGWKDPKSGKPLSMTREAAWRSALETAEAKQMMGQVYQSWGRQFRHAQGRLQGEGYRIWSGVFGGTYQEPLDIRSVPDPIKNLMELTGSYSLKSGWYKRSLTQEAWARNPETGDPEAAFAQLPVTGMPQEVARLVAEATRGKGMTWTTEQAAWMLGTKEGGREQREAIQRMLESKISTPKFAAEYMKMAYGKKGAHYQEALMGSAPIFTSMRQELFRRREGDIGEETKYGYLYNLAEQELEAAGEGKAVREYMRLAGKGAMSPHEVAAELMAAGRPELSAVTGRVTGQQPEWLGGEMASVLADVGETLARSEGPRLTPDLANVIQRGPTMGLGDIPPDVSVGNAPAQQGPRLAFPEASTLAQQAIAELAGGMPALQREAERIRAYKQQHGRSAVPRNTLFRQALNAMMETGRATPADIEEYKNLIAPLGVGLEIGSTGAPSHIYTGLVGGAPSQPARQQAPRQTQPSTPGGSPPPPPPGGPPGGPPNVPPGGGPPDWWNQDPQFAGGTPPGAGGQQGAASSSSRWAKPWETGVWMGKKELGLLQEANEQLGAWGEVIAEAITSTGEVNKAQQEFLKTFEQYENAYLKGTKTVEQLDERLQAYPDAPDEWKRRVNRNFINAQAAVQELEGNQGFAAMQAAAGQYQARQRTMGLVSALAPGGQPVSDKARGFLDAQVPGWQDMLGGGQPPSRLQRFAEGAEAGWMGKLSSGLERFTSGWELMRLSRMWNITGAPVFDQYMPAAAQAEMASYQLSSAMGGYTGEMPGGAAGGLMAYEAAQRQSVIEAGRTGYQAWGWTRKSMSGLKQAQALLGPAAGYGLIAGALAGTAGMAFGGLGMGAAAAASLPITLGVAGVAGAIGLGNYAVGAATPTMENALKAYAQEKDPGFLGVNWAAASANAGQLLGNIGTAWNWGKQALSGVNVPAPQFTWGISEKQIAQGEALASTQFSQMDNEQRAAALSYMARELHGLGGTVFEATDETQILQAAGGLLPYYQPKSPDDVINFGSGEFRQALEQTLLTGQGAEAYEDLAGSLYMGKDFAARMFREVGAMPEMQKQRVASALGQYAGLTKYGRNAESVYSDVKSDVLKKREGAELQALEKAYEVMPQITQALGITDLQGAPLMDMMLGLSPEQIDSIGIGLPYAASVIQATGMDQELALKRFADMQMRGVSPQSMGIVAQAMQGQSPYALARGELPGFATMTPLDEMLEGNRMEATEYQQNVTLADLADPVAQVTGMDRDELQARFGAMRAAGVSQVGMNIVSQALQGQGAFMQALGAPAGLAGMSRFDTMVELNQLQPMQYQGLTSMAGLGMSQLGWNMMAGGFGVGPELSQFMSQQGFSTPGYNLRTMDYAAIPGGGGQMGLYQRGALEQRAAAWSNLGSQQAYQLEGLNNSIARLADTFKTYTEPMQALAKEQSQAGYEYSLQSLGFARAGAAMSFRHSMESLGLQEKGFRQNVAYQQTQMGMQYEQMQTQREWQLEDFAYGRQVSGMQYEYQMGELDRNIRFATGRQKESLLRQRSYQEEMFSMQEGRRGVEEERAKTQFEWQESGFALQKQHFEETTALQEEQFAMQKRHLEESFALQMAQYDAQEAHIHKMKELEDKQRELQEENQKKQYEWQMADLERQKTYYEEVVFPYQRQQLQWQNELEDAVAAYNALQIALYSPGGALYNAIQALVDLVNSYTPPSPTGGLGPAQAATQPIPNAAGGPVYPGTSYVVGELGPELFVPDQAGQIVPSIGDLFTGKATVSVGNIEIKVSGAGDPKAVAEEVYKQFEQRVNDLAERQRDRGDVW